MNEKSAAAPPRDVMSRFAFQVLSPIAKIFMRFGLSARDFSDIARWVFVKVFYSTPEFWVNGEPTALQGAIKTGLPRKQVKVLSEIPEPPQAMFTQRQNLAYRVIEGWVKDPEFHVNGGPTSLPISHPSEPSFRRLLERYGDGVTQGSVLNDLKQVGCVSVNGNTVALVSRTYGMHFLDEDRLAIAGYMLRRLGETTDYNLTHPSLDDRRLQRFWWQVLIPIDKAPDVRRRAREEGVRHGREMDRILGGYAHASPQEGVRYVEVGFSAFVYEAEIDVEDGVVKDDLKQRSGIR